LQINVDEARPYWAHPSQHVMGSHPDNLPDHLEYWANGPVCLAFHRMPWPAVWMVHCGVKRDGLGQYVDPARRILRAFADHTEAELITSWTAQSNRAVLAFAKRVGFTVDGELSTKSNPLVMSSWRP